MFNQRFARFRGGMYGRRPSTPVADPTDHYLRQAVEWVARRNTFNPGPYVPEDPNETDENRDWNTKMWRRGLGNLDDYNFIYTTLVRNGLDVVLNLPDLPEGEDFFWEPTSAFWTDARYNLLRINTIPGPLWLNFVASDYRHTTPNYEFHISLCYQDELWSWFREDRDYNKIIEWIQRYRILQTRYNGRSARLMGKLTGGLGLELDARTRVDGLDPPYIVADVEGGDEDVRYVHTLLGHIPRPRNAGKADQPLHVSLLID